MENFDYDVVRMLYDFHLRFNELPTKSLNAKLSEAIYYNGYEKTLRKILHAMGFRFTKMKDTRKVLIEKHDVSLKRMEYHYKIREFRETGKNSLKSIWMSLTYIHHTLKDYLGVMITKKMCKKANFKRSTFDNSSCGK